MRDKFGGSGTFSGKETGGLDQSDTILDMEQGQRSPREAVEEKERDTGRKGGGREGRASPCSPWQDQIGALGILGVRTLRESLPRWKYGWMGGAAFFGTKVRLNLFSPWGYHTLLSLI